jgi:hypothetical protein
MSLDEREKIRAPLLTRTLKNGGVCDRYGADNKYHQLISGYPGWIGFRL